MVNDWWEQNDPMNTGSGFPEQAIPSGDPYGTPTWNPNAQGQNTGVSGYGAGAGVQTPPVTPTAPSGALVPGSMEWILAELQKVNSTDDPNYWLRVIANDPKVKAGDQSAIAYWVDRIRRGDGSELVKNGTLTKFADGDGSGGYGFGAGTKPYKDFELGDFTKDPGYQFTLGEGLKAISARKAAQGGLLTGGTDKARANYATGLASQTYNDFYNRSANSYQMNQGNYFTGLNSAFDKWYKTTQLGANAAAQ